MAEAGQEKLGRARRQRVGSHSGKPKRNRRAVRAPDTILPSMLPQFRAHEDPNRMPKPIERGRRAPDVRLGG